MTWQEFRDEYGLSDEDAYRFYDGPIPRYHEEYSRKVRAKYWKWFKITLVITILWIIFGIAFLIR